MSLFRMSVQKLVVRGTGKMSLHERFTQLRFDQKATTTSKVNPDSSSYSASSYLASSYSAPSYSPPRARIVPTYLKPARPAATSSYSPASVAVAARRPATSYGFRSNRDDSWMPSYTTTRMSRPAARTGTMGRSQAASLSVGRMPSQSASMMAAAKVFSYYYIYSVVGKLLLKSS
jgi:hypothetical protein